MGYDLHFTRADHWPDSVMYPISLQEWVAVADEEPRLTKHQRDGHHPVYELAAPDDEGSNWTLGWRDGMVTIWKAHEASAELAAIARKLGARLVGDDSEEYHPDGDSTPWTGPRPILFSRPLHLDEAAPAWQEMFERRAECVTSSDPGPDHARHAFRAFEDFAGREVAAADVPDADGLLYQYGPFGSDGERAFVLSFVRQLATGPGDGLVQVECRLDYRMTPDLAGLGTVTEWWFPEDGLVRDAWFAALADRPEWRLLNILTPKAFTFSSDTVC